MLHSLQPDALPFPHSASSVTPSSLLLLIREHLHRSHSPPGLTLRHKDLPRAPQPRINYRLYLARQGSEGCNPGYAGNKSRRITSSRPAWALELVQDQHEKFSETISKQKVSFERLGFSPLAWHARTLSTGCSLNFSQA